MLKKIGFRDDFIYRFIEKKCEDNSVMEIIELDRMQCLQLFDEYQKKNKTIY